MARHAGQIACPHGGRESWSRVHGLCCEYSHTYFISRYLGKPVIWAQLKHLFARMCYRQKASRKLILWPARICPRRCCNISHTLALTDVRENLREACPPLPYPSAVSSVWSHNLTVDGEPSVGTGSGAAASWTWFEIVFCNSKPEGQRLGGQLQKAALPGGECLLGSVFAVYKMHIGVQFAVLGLLLPWALLCPGFLVGASGEEGLGRRQLLTGVCLVGSVLALCPCGKLFFSIWRGPEGKHRNGHHRCMVQHATHT